MKGLTKIIINALVVVLLAVSCFGLVGCKKDIKTVELTISLYDYENNEMYDESDVTITIDLYRHLAPKTVDKMVEYVNDGYYDGAIFYKMVGQSNQIMLGDLKLVNNEIVQNAIMPTIEGEFEYGGTIGSNLVNEKGSIGLWRTWTAYDEEQGDYYKTNTSIDTGRATWYMPTTSITSYNKWMCVFGKLVLDNESTATAIEGIINAFSDGGEYEEYVVYYTGEYDESKVNDNHGLEFHCVPIDEFDEDMADLFVAEGSQYACYNHYTIQVPVTGTNGSIAAKVVSAKVI
ncbi:MAG: peptidylprolyl isomerase [Clostridia bacterium]|nr:peptidylprolyl isomerase [Clostridia bacterium]